MSQDHTEGSSICLDCDETRVETCTDFDGTGVETRVDLDEVGVHGVGIDCDTEDRAGDEAASVTSHGQTSLDSAGIALSAGEPVDKAKSLATLVDP